MAQSSLFLVWERRYSLLFNILVVAWYVMCVSAQLLSTCRQLRHGIGSNGTSELRAAWPVHALQEISCITNFYFATKVSLTGCS